MIRAKSESTTHLETDLPETRYDPFREDGGGEKPQKQIAQRRGRREPSGVFRVFSGCPDANLFFLTMFRQHSQYDSRLGFSFRVLVRGRVSVMVLG